MRCCPQALDLGALASKLRHGARLMIGQGDYDAYVAHWRRAHAQQAPSGAPMTRAEFFRAREAARFGAGGERAFRCC